MALFCPLGHGPVMAIFELLDYIVNEVRKAGLCLGFFYLPTG